MSLYLSLQSVSEPPSVNSATAQGAFPQSGLGRARLSTSECHAAEVHMDSERVMHYVPYDEYHQDLEHEEIVEHCWFLSTSCPIFKYCIVTAHLKVPQMPTTKVSLCPLFPFPKCRPFTAMKFDCFNLWISYVCICSTPVNWAKLALFNFMF